MSDMTTRLGLPFIAPSQAQKHVTHNEALQVLDVLVQLVLDGIGSEAPPETPEPGETHALGPAPSGDWAGQAGNVAHWVAPAWQFLTPQPGWRAWDKAGARLVIHEAGEWIPPAPDLDNLGGVGIGTTSDTFNRLAVASEAVLLTHAGGGHRLKINKAGAADTASLLYQSGFTGHAEMGLAGDTDFHVKVSPDGAAWTEALVLDATTGQASGAAVQAAADDATAGRLMRVGAFGLGAGAVPYGAGDDLDTLPSHTHFFRFDAGADLPANAPFDGFGAGLQIERSASLKVQVVWRFATVNNANMWMRSRTSDGWGGWVLQFDQSTVLGTVTQSGGVPTGALIEHGSNANGSYVRFADGMQVCHHSFTPSLTITVSTGGGFRSNTEVSSFPASFAASPQVSASTESFTNWVNVRGSSTTSALLRRYSFVSSTDLEPISYIAIGRWF